ncbi:hypothetical protein O0550_13170 [Brevibacillus halotolerans]|uniref:hypothetical protein n=1 Tax=Brevibacillus TaxID=55080 RepID=UPI00215C0228|nr:MULTISPECIES: hypothetical protein [Brevibacillus]MCR8964146.1 hypothetical protein [Brevibacillus laterosporus]MCZ0836301.1 hypothetical protein [Brevibacillus halotolerans]
MLLFSDTIASCTGARIETWHHYNISIDYRIASCTGARIETWHHYNISIDYRIASYTEARIETRMSELCFLQVLSLLAQERG